MEMYDPLPFLPKRFQKIIASLKAWKAPPKFIFFTLGILATLWFLIRVVPKPSRASYPCMQATAPFMSGFVLYTMGITGSIATFRRFRSSFKQSRYFLALMFLLVACCLFLLTTFQFPGKLKAVATSSTINYFTPNDPIGIAKGIVPGRVVWMWNPEATNENCTNTSNNNGVIDPGDDAWFMAKNNNMEVIDSMMFKSVTSLTESSNVPQAWDKLFRFFNINHGKGDVGYTAGEKILIKVNATTAYGGLSYLRFNADLSRTDNLQYNDFSSETDPFLVLSLLRQLVSKAGVPDTLIYIGDPARNIYREFFDLWRGEFPGVKVLGNDLIHTELNVAALGRTPVAVTTTNRVFFSDHGTVMPDAITDKLFTIFDDIAYLINVPALKAHSTGGITLAAKNHFGSFTREWAMHLHSGLMDGTDNPLRLGYGLYRVQTDIMMHNLLSGKNLLIIIDGLYPGEDALAKPDKWISPPFNNDWCSSIFMSLDPVAIESVGHDFLRTEYNGPTIPESRPNWFGVDDYLHQAADSSLWPDGIVYDPDNDQILIASLGVHEHWNDSLHKQYTRNLGIGDGIELFKAHEVNTGAADDHLMLNVRIFPNPARDFLLVSIPDYKNCDYLIWDAEGKVVIKGTSGNYRISKISLNHLQNGLYFLQVQIGNQTTTVKFIKE